ncbi:MAG TPA: SMI1/KNR4 family protein [Abditibacterium sp.]|jgi:hypothetical protein
MDLEKEIFEIKALIDELRDIDTDFRVFGASSHRYQFGPTLSETELREFEQQHKIVLPPDYRFWLREIGNGNGFRPSGHQSLFRGAGAGPGYGLYNLFDTVIDKQPDLPFSTQLLEMMSNGWLSFPLADDERFPGVLEIQTEGCANATYLVVNGDSYGTIWSVWSSNELCPTQLSFSQWMRNWLDKSIPIARAERVTYPIEIGMTAKEVIAICGDNGKRVNSVNYSILRFEGLQTGFELNQEKGNRVVRILK